MAQQEFEHHLRNLLPIRERVIAGEQLTEAERTLFTNKCKWVLLQNPHSLMAAELLTALTKGTEQEVAVLIPKHTEDTTDLITGDIVVNIPFSNMSQQLGESLHRGFIQAKDITATGRRVDLRQLVDVCNQRGPFRGFARILSREELIQLSAADNTLAERCYYAFIRLCLAEDVTKITQKANAALETHIAPLVAQVGTLMTRQSIAETLELWKNNRQNPYKNFYHRTNRVAEPGEEIGRKYAMPLYLLNSNFFSVGKLNEGIAGNNIPSGYDPATRVLLLRQQTDEYDFLHALNVVHELTHVAQHNRFLKKYGQNNPTRIRASQEAYLRPMLDPASTAHGILENECEAFANMIELIMARTGFGKMMIGDMLPKLGLDPSDKNATKLYRLMLFAMEYYKGDGRRGDRFPAGYMKTIDDFYRSKGIHLIHMDEIKAPA